MSNVQRYSFDVDYGLVETTGDGRWVRADDYAALERECEALRAQVAQLEELTDRNGAIATDCIYAAEQRCAEMAKDAARYRYLRQPDNCILYAKIPHYWGRPGHHAHVAYSTATELDEAVDSAIRQVEIDSCLAASPQGSSPAGAGQQEKGT